MQNPQLRIALYSPNLPESGGSNGIITYCGIMRDALRALGHAVLIVTPEQIEHDDGRVAPLPRLNPVLLHFRRLIDSARFDKEPNSWGRLRVLQAFRVALARGAQIFEMEESFGWAGCLSGRGIPVVERLHGPHAFVRDSNECLEQKAISDRRETWEWSSLAKVQAVTSPTQRLLDAIIERSGVRPSVSRVIPNPIPIVPEHSRWLPDQADPDRILFVGRFDLCKGADVVVRAFARAAEFNPCLRLLIAGPDRGVRRGSEVIHFGEFVQAELSPEARARISFLGELPPREITKLRLRSSLAVVGSRFENFPYGIAEAMAVGMPVLTSATFGGSEMIRDGIDGRVVPIENVDAMADAILVMMNDRDSLGAMGASAYQRAARWLDPDRIAGETVNLYRELLSRSQ
jgi:glycosyltransferase involved in cell wall biosynthesis